MPMKGVEVFSTYTFPGLSLFSSLSWAMAFLPLTGILIEKIIKVVKIRLREVKLWIP